MKYLSGHALFLLVLLAAGQVRAEEVDAAPSPWSFTSYGTLGFSQDTADNLGFARDLSQCAHYSHSGTWFSDSRIGLQAAYRHDPRTDLVVQAVVRDKAGANLGNSIEWAYLAHRPLPELNLRLGRMGIDVFLLSDYRNLGYAQTTVRPDLAFYGFMPIYAVDGLDASYTLDGDTTRWTFKSQVGRSQARVPMASDIFDFAATGFLDVSVVRESGPWRVKAGYARMKSAKEAPLGELTGPLDDLAAANIPVVSGEAAALAQDARMQGARIDYLALGASYDDGRWLAQAEVSHLSADRRIVVSGDAAYLNVGRRIGAFTPYVGLSRFQPAHPAVAAQSDWAAVTLDPAMGVLQTAALATVNTTRIDQRIVSLGLRWDFHPQADLKLQWDRISIGRDGFGLWGTQTGSPGGSERVNLVTATLDWVF